MNWIDTVLGILNYLGYFSTVVVIISFCVGAVLCFRGFVPVLIRLGNGLWKRKIAVLAKGDALSSLVTLLHDSKLFKHANILQIATENDLGVAEKAGILLVHWPSFGPVIEKILDQKKDATALIVYAPQEGGPIPGAVMHSLEKRRNVVVNNFRGRLLNDLVISMITTGYEKK